MANEVDLASLDLRYEGFRLKQPALEARLLPLIAQRGIEEPLEGVQVQEAKVLLNGFKRHRCARQLRLATVPYSSLGQDEAGAILSLLRIPMISDTQSEIIGQRSDNCRTLVRDCRTVVGA